ncbi:MAG: bifunctional folylpolyglutamate synthase/dihydrofolate synthase [Thermoplasmatota archaeon]
MWSYEEALAWLYDRQALGIKLGLGKVRRLLAGVDSPQEAFRSVHIAGTNGKGSVARMMAAVLRESGYATGLTTSPHLVSFTERIEIDGKLISKAAVAEGLARLRPHVDDLDQEGVAPTFFEVVTALAFLAFRDAGVAWAVVETGMGGRLDATNVLQPELTVITNVELDHEAHLGSTVAEIAWEKSGILKRGVPLVTGAEGDALRVLVGRSHEEMVPMSVVGAAPADYVVVSDDELLLVRPNGDARYRVALAGQHQRRNAALVVAGAEALRTRGVDVPERAVRKALGETTHPGRLERFTWHGIEVLVDGAHNPAAARALGAHLAETGWQGVDLVAGFCADKAWQACLEAWRPAVARLWAVPVRNPRSLDAATLARASPWPARTRPDVAAALAAAQGAGARRILVAGSLFLAGEARAVLTGQSLEEIRGRQ